MEFELSEEQKAVIDGMCDMSSENNILVPGKAGVGKSVTFRETRRKLDEMGAKGFVCAPTGVAAINIGGETIHRVISFLRSSQKIKPDYILIDEDSMCRADLLDELDSACFSCTHIDQPFGGIKVGLFGDPGQLPPVLKENTAEAEYINDNYFSPYFFSSAAYSQCNWKVIELTKIFRQSDPDFMLLLNNIREGKVKKTIKYLNEYHQTDKPQGVFLTPTNAAAEEINSFMLNRLEGELHRFPCVARGKIQPHEYPAPGVLEVKVGAQIMIVKNLYDESGEFLVLTNGDTGEITGINPQSQIISFLCKRTGQVHEIQPVVWEQEESKYDSTLKELTKVKVASFTQYPIRLAWAITIHKSQGATLPEMTVDLRRPLFAPGQLYVALSRAVSLDTLHILGKVSEKDVIVCPIIKEFLKDYKSHVGIKPGSKFEKYFENRQKSRSELESIFN